MHPVVVGKRALPAMPLPEIASGAALRTLPLLGREHDILMLISSGALTGAECELLYAARAAGLTTIALCGATAHDSSDQQCGVAEQAFRAPEKTPGVPSVPGAPRARHHVFIVPCADACIVQETHEMLYHVLWELVHVFFEHRAG